MAKYIVSPKKKRDEQKIVKCGNCSTMFVAEENNHGWSENCPTCGNSIYIKWNRIPLWRYNLIKWFRGKINNEEE